MDSPQPTTAYHIKWVTLAEVKYPVINQNENGPCPLLAIMNLLILRGVVKLPPMMEIITADQLLDYLGDAILSAMPSNLSENALINYHQNMSDAMTLLPDLTRGLDVNVRFTGVQDFEYTPNSIVFDLLSIPLYHGWVVDDEDEETRECIGRLTYNQVAEKIVNDLSAEDGMKMAQAIKCDEFLRETASQLTVTGLKRLTERMKEHEVAVFFRNNHFNTVMKHKGVLYQLVTDQGFLNEDSVVWESLSNVAGDGQFTDGDFGEAPPQTTREQQIEQDEQLARQIQLEEEAAAQEEAAATTEQSRPAPPPPAAEPAVARSPTSSSNGSTKKTGCTIS